MQFTHFVKYIGKNLRMNLYPFLLEIYWSHIFNQNFTYHSKKWTPILLPEVEILVRSPQGSVVMIDEQLLILRPTTPSLALLFTS